jgi:flagellar hook-basal body complex protein FliE
MTPLDENMRIGIEGSHLLPSTGTGKVPGAEDGEKPFKDVLRGLVDKVDTLQKDANASIQDLVTGETTDIHNVAVKMKEAEVAFGLMMEVRNKLVEAYQEIIKMQP